MDNLVPTIRDLRPYPESQEARALGCYCSIARRHGNALLTRNGSPIFAIERDCPVHDNPLRELAIWDDGEKRKRHSSAVEAEQPSVEQRGRIGEGAGSFRSDKSLDDFVFEGTSINEALVREIHAGAFLAEAQNVLLVGATGSGKTHLALAIANQATKWGKRGRFFTAFDLIKRLEYEVACGIGAFMFELAQDDFVVIDELGYLPISRRGRSLLYHLLARLDEKSSVIVTTHLHTAQWVDIFRDRDLTQALVDRFMRRCFLVETGAKSWRAARPVNAQDATVRTLEKLGQIRNVLKRGRRAAQRSARIAGKTRR
jgi:DNA replication protein DnaC